MRRIDFGKSNGKRKRAAPALQKQRQDWELTEEQEDSTFPTSSAVPAAAPEAIVRRKLAAWNSSAEADKDFALPAAYVPMGIWIRSGPIEPFALPSDWPEMRRYLSVAPSHYRRVLVNKYSDSSLKGITHPDEHPQCNCTLENDNADSEDEACSGPEADDEDWDGGGGSSHGRGRSKRKRVKRKAAARSGAVIVGRGCGEGCLNRQLYMECVPKQCKSLRPHETHCANTRIQRRDFPATEVFRTPDGRGWGLRLAERKGVAAGTMLHEYAGEVIDLEECCERLDNLGSDGRNGDFYLAALTSDLVIDAGPMGSEARFANHSCEPNCAMQKWNVQGESRLVLVALEDLSFHDELTYNYRAETMSGLVDRQRCDCGAQRCAGFIGASYVDPNAKIGKKKNAAVKAAFTQKKTKAKGALDPLELWRAAAVGMLRLERPPLPVVCELIDEGQLAALELTEKALEALEPPPEEAASLALVAAAEKRKAAASSLATAATSVLESREMRCLLELQAAADAWLEEKTRLLGSSKTAAAQRKRERQLKDAAKAALVEANAAIARAAAQLEAAAEAGRESLKAEEAEASKDGVSDNAAAAAAAAATATPLAAGSTASGDSGEPSVLPRKSPLAGKMETEAGRGRSHCKRTASVAASLQAVSIDTVKKLLSRLPDCLHMEEETEIQRLLGRANDAERSVCEVLASLQLSEHAADPELSPEAEEATAAATATATAATAAAAAAAGAAADAAAAGAAAGASADAAAGAAADAAAAAAAAAGKELAAPPGKLALQQVLKALREARLVSPVIVPSAAKLAASTVGALADWARQACQILRLRLLEEDEALGAIEAVVCGTTPPPPSASRRRTSERPLRPTLAAALAAREWLRSPDMGECRALVTLELRLGEASDLSEAAAAAASGAAGDAAEDGDFSSRGRRRSRSKLQPALWLANSGEDSDEGGVSPGESGSGCRSKRAARDKRGAAAGADGDAFPGEAEPEKLTVAAEPSRRQTLASHSPAAVSRPEPAFCCICEGTKRAAPSQFIASCCRCRRGFHLTCAGVKVTAGERRNLDTNVLYCPSCCHGLKRPSGLAMELPAGFYQSQDRSPTLADLESLVSAAENLPLRLDGLASLDRISDKVTELELWRARAQTVMAVVDACQVGLWHVGDAKAAQTINGSSASSRVSSSKAIAATEPNSGGASGLPENGRSSAAAVSCAAALVAAARKNGASEILKEEDVAWLDRIAAYVRADAGGGAASASGLPLDGAGLTLSACRDWAFEGLLVERLVQLLRQGAAENPTWKDLRALLWRMVASAALDDAEATEGLEDVCTKPRAADQRQNGDAGNHPSFSSESVAAALPVGATKPAGVQRSVALGKEARPPLTLDDIDRVLAEGQRLGQESSSAFESLARAFKAAKVGLVVAEIADFRDARNALPALRKLAAFVDVQKEWGFARAQASELVHAKQWPGASVAMAQEKEHDDAAAEVYCICRTGDDGRFMLQCDACQLWLHGACIGLPNKRAYEAARRAKRARLDSERERTSASESGACGQEESLEMALMRQQQEQQQQFQQQQQQQQLAQQLPIGQALVENGIPAEGLVLQMGVAQLPHANGYAEAPAQNGFLLQGLPAPPLLVLPTSQAAGEVACAAAPNAVGPIGAIASPSSGEMATPRLRRQARPSKRLQEADYSDAGEKEVKALAVAAAAAAAANAAAAAKAAAAAATAAAAAAAAAAGTAARKRGRPAEATPTFACVVCCEMRPDIYGAFPSEWGSDCVRIASKQAAETLRAQKAPPAAASKPPEAPASASGQGLAYGAHLQPAVRSQPLAGFAEAGVATAMPASEATHPQHSHGHMQEASQPIFGSAGGEVGATMQAQQNVMWCTNRELLRQQQQQQHVPPPPLPPHQPQQLVVQL